MKIPDNDNTREEYYIVNNDNTYYCHVYDRDAVTGEYIQPEETPSETFTNGEYIPLSNDEATADYEEAVESIIAANPNYWQEAHGSISNTSWNVQDEGSYQEIRQGLTILPADEPGRQRIGGVIRETIGDVIVNNSYVNHSISVGEMLNLTRRPMSFFVIPKKSKTEKILMEIIRKGLEKHGDGWTLDDGLTLSQEEKETIVAIENEIRNERGKPGVNLEKQP